MQNQVSLSIYKLAVWYTPKLTVQKQPWKVKQLGARCCLKLKVENIYKIYVYTLHIYIYIQHLLPQLYHYTYNNISTF